MPFLTKISTPKRLTVLFSVLLAFGILAGKTLVFKPALAYRTGTQYVCQTGQTWLGNGRLPNGKTYASVEYWVAGNDYGRAGDNGGNKVTFETGWRVDSNDPRCQPQFGNGVLWDGQTVDLNSNFYKFLFGTRLPDHIYLGILPGTNAQMIEDYSIVGGGDIKNPATGNFWRTDLGVDKTHQVPFAAVNDGGDVQINGKSILCFGMALDEFTNDPVCRGVNEVTVYKGGCDCAGYLNVGTPNSVKNLAPQFQNPVANSQPIENLLPLPKFNLVIHGINTRDGLGGSNYALCNWVVPNASPCDKPGIQPDPFINNKLGIVLTFEISDAPPQGAIESATCDTNTGNGSITGWAVDPDFPTAAINVFATIDAPVGTAGSRLVTFPFPAKNADPNVVPAMGPLYGPNHGFSIDVKDFSDAYSHTFYIYAYNTKDNSGAIDPTATPQLIGTRQLGPCAPPKCNPLINPPAVETGTPFSESVGYIYAPGGKGKPISPIGSVTINGVTKSVSYGPPSTTNGNTQPPPTFQINSVGKYTITWVVVQFPTFGFSCSASITVANHPYVGFYGNDVSAGGAFNTLGNCSQSSAIRTYFNVSSGGGAGVEFAARALNTIDGFASSSLHYTTPGNANSDNNLSLANTGASPGFFGDPHCIYNYWQNAPLSPQPFNPHINLSAGSPYAGDSFRFNVPAGNFLTIDPSVIPTGDHVAIYVDGDVVITADAAGKSITFDTATPWASTDKIPSLYLIVRGNIKIDSSVQQMDGVYIAEPKAAITAGNPDVSTNGGRIYTCTVGQTIIPAAFLGGLYSVCNKRLTINGAFIAQETNFLRAVDTLSNAAHGEVPSNSHAAEVFNFTPETYLSNPQLPHTTFGQYNYLTSLPPVL